MTYPIMNVREKVSMVYWCSPGCFDITGTIEDIYDVGTDQESYTIVWDGECICRCPEALPIGRISADLLSAR